LPAGLGDPVYEKLEANLAQAMMSLPATKGFEIGSGFRSVVMPGSEHNDLFFKESGKVQTQTNNAGGTLGGISTGMPLIGRIAFKPTSSIMKSQETLSISGEEASFKLPVGSRHDPCVAIRAVPIVEAMTGLVLVDAILLNRCVKL
jgi:chorismate synthase